MSLAPGETFEHTHQGESVTILLEGSVDVIVGETRTSLVIGVPATIPAGVSHVLVNVGSVRAAVECVHEPAASSP